jgi:hypothetical protein
MSIDNNGSPAESPESMDIQGMLFFIDTHEALS